MTSQPDLFGDAPAPEKKRKTTRANGYAWRPGTGPKGETCASCAHKFRKTYLSKPVYKCSLARERWGRTRRTDILVRSPACKYWQEQDDE